MSKKKGMFSWLGLGRQQEEVVEEVTDTVEASSEAEELSNEKVDEIKGENLVINETDVEANLAEPEPCITIYN